MIRRAGEVEAALEPLRVTLLARAASDAEAARQAADAESAALLAAARDQAAELLARARAAGTADADRHLAAERTRAGRAARQLVLDAQRDAYEQLRARARVAVAARAADPAWRYRLAAALARRLNGPVSLRDDPAGGVVAQAADGRRIDASAGALVDATLADLDLDRLWQP